MIKPRKGNPRSAARALALQGLFMLDVQGDAGFGAARDYTASQEVPPEVRDYALQLLDGTWKMRAAFDARIAAVAEHWDLARIAIADRNIIRLALYEMTQVPEVPAKAAISEAVELAKRFSTAESTRFVNGILDRLLHSNIRGDLGGGSPAVEPPADEGRG
jgi:N utilization substance protein B